MIKDLINKLDKVLKFSKQSFKISKIKSSDTEVEYAELVEGAEVLVSSSQGSTVATDGEYELENGDKFIVKDGVIAEVISIQPEEKVEEMEKEDEEEKIEEVIEEVEAPEEEETVEIDITEETVETSEGEESESKEDEKKEKHEVNKVEALKAEVEALKEMIEALKAELPKSIEDFKNSFMKELKTTPAQSFNAVVEEKPTNKWLEIARLKNKNKKI
ncbi:hypothetical protein [Sphingobacterium mizutaii]|uniref:hypothetical protein n=1 Tax=Sphingobacterium mizutaii TaxID=1010 RepID=UPI0016243A38|nr:hypothetical protein [Sphingobacterium mizutaii]